MISKFTKNEAIELAKKTGNSMPWYEDTITLLEQLGLISFKPEPIKLDWNAPLKIKTRVGVVKVYYLGIGWKGKRLVQIETDPSNDGSIPNVYSPDENGYVVQFDTWIENC